MTSPTRFRPELKRLCSLAELGGLRSLAAIEDFARRINLAPGIVVGRLQHDRIIGYQVGHKLFVRYRLGSAELT